jgi:RNA polymerase sigma-70 factor (ECF subfamily)
LESLSEIIEGCVRNDHRDQKRLYEKYYGYALKIVFRYIYRYEKAVDVSNDGFVKIFKKINQFHCEIPENTEKMLMGWIRTIMINTAIDRLRKDNFLPEIGHINESMWIEDKRDRSDQTLLYKELIQEVRKLPTMYRLVFNMHVIDGFTHQEIAAHLKIATGTSKSNLSKARSLLQKVVRNNETEKNICGM